MSFFCRVFYYFFEYIKWFVVDSPRIINVDLALQINPQKELKGNQIGRYGPVNVTSFLLFILLFILFDILGIFVTETN